MARRGRESAGRRELTGQQATLIVGGLLLLGLTLAWFLFLRGGSSDDVAAPSARPSATTSAEPEPSPLPSLLDPKPPKKGPVETFEVFAPKDPFKPLVSAAGLSGGTTSGTAGGTPVSTADGGSTDGATGPGTAPAPGTGNGNGSGGGGGSNVDGHTVKLVDVFTDKGRRRAQVQVDGTVYTVDEGETFAENFKVLSTSGNCASLLFGDDQFTICEGEEILK